LLPIYRRLRTFAAAHSLAAVNLPSTTANIVQPGSIDTDMNPAHGPFGDPMRQLTASGRFGAGTEIGHAVAYLASNKARYVTGTTLTVDGGANA